MGEEMDAKTFCEMMGPEYVAGLAERLRERASQADGAVAAALEMGPGEDPTSARDVALALTRACESDPDAGDCAGALGDLYAASRAATLCARALEDPTRPWNPEKFGGMDRYEFAERALSELERPGEGGGVEIDLDLREGFSFAADLCEGALQSLLVMGPGEDPTSARDVAVAARRCELGTVETVSRETVGELFAVAALLRRIAGRVMLWNEGDYSTEPRTPPELAELLDAAVGLLGEGGDAASR